MHSRAVLFVILAAIAPAGTAWAHDVPPPPREPYRWVVPPPGVERPAPEGTVSTVDLTQAGSVPTTVTTPDRQAHLVLSQGAFAPRGSAAAVEVSVEPVDSRGEGPAPQGFALDGNAYRVLAEYVPSGRPAPLSEPVTLSLQYPAHGHMLLIQDGGSWRRVRSNGLATQRVVVGVVEQTGVYVAAARPGGPGPRAAEGLPGWLLPASGAAVILVLIGLDRVVRRRAED